MITRALQQNLINALQNMPVVALLGARQVGKTTLALQVSELVEKETACLDLELDRCKRADEKTAQFLLLDSASRDLIQQSSETLAG